LHPIDVASHGGTNPFLDLRVRIPRGHLFGGPRSCYLREGSARGQDSGSIARLADELGGSLGDNQLWIAHDVVAQRLVLGQSQGHGDREQRLCGSSQPVDDQSAEDRLGRCREISAHVGIEQLEPDDDQKAGAIESVAFERGRNYRHC